MEHDLSQGIPAQQLSPQLEVQRTESPKYLTGDHFALTTLVFANSD
jgi:hypothetical protein